MKTSIRQSLVFPILVLCCVLPGAVRAQDVDPAAAGKDAVVESPAESIRPHHRWRKRHGDTVVSIGHSADLEEGRRVNSVIAIFGEATSAGEVDDSVVSVLGGTRVTGKVGDAAVAVLGNVYVNGRVDGDVVAVLGNVELGPEAEIRGDVVVVGGILSRDPKAIVNGGVQTVFSGGLGDFGWLRPWIERCLLYGRPLAFAPGLHWAWRIALGLLALYLFLAFLFRGAVDRCVQILETQPGHSILAALLTMLLTPVAFVLLGITVLGIPAIPILALGLLCAAVFGKVVVLASIGRRCTAFLAASPLVHTMVGVLVGGLIVLALYTIPVVGFVLYKLLGILGLGAVIYTLLLVVRAGKEARAAPAQSAAGGSAGSAPQGSTAPPGTGPSGAAFSATPDGVAAQTSREHDAAPRPGADAATHGYASSGAIANRLALPRAGFWIRMGALLLDALLVGILLHQVHEGTNLALTVLAAYGAVMWKLKASTIGGIICGLQVVRLDGRPIDWATAIVRALSCFLSLAVVGLGFLWIAIDREKQSWHDKIAGTVVVRAPKDMSLL